MTKTNALVTRSESRALAKYSARVMDYAKRSKAKNTTRAYSTAWRDFTDWCAAQGVQSLPAAAESVASWLTHLADSGLRLNTISVKRAAVASAHRTAGHTDPSASELVKMTYAGIARSLAEAGRTQPRRKAPVTDDVLRQLVSEIDRETLPGKRDAALLLVGFAGAFRRSELVAVDVEDLRFTAHDLRITVRRSKTDQTGEGLVKVLPRLSDESMCPVRALREWLNAAGINSGAVFRAFNKWGTLRARLKDQHIARLVQRLADAAGLDRRQFAGHSLRAGFVTAAHNHGADSLSIRQQTGHQSDRMVSIYIRDGGNSAKTATRAAFGEKIE
jgi:site-specific recombinase XerD